jgi:hypothetical protein
MKRTKTYPGYIALTAVLILSSILLLVIISYTYVSILRRLNYQDAALKTKSRLAAESCLEEARLRLAVNSSYAGNEIITIANGSDPIHCVILPVTVNGTQKTLSVQGSVASTASRPITNIVLVVDGTTLEQISRQEIVDL